MPRKTEVAAPLAANRAIDWRPSATLPTLRRRAALASDVRAYFAAAGVLEVHTPVLMPWASCDPALYSFSAQPAHGAAGPSGYLQTSPEFALKRLLAAGAGDIYQLGPAFRAEEAGRHHLAEFTMLEWYRLGFDHHALMDDVEGLVSAVMPELRFSRRAYGELFAARYGFNPHTTGVAALADLARGLGLELGTLQSDRTALLDGLFADLLLREEAAGEGLFVYDFPVEQAAYARINDGPPAIAERFELIVDGLEIANGYCELTDAAEQAERMQAENARRAALALPEIEIDPCLLAALAAGLPACAGVALGFDRLVMLVAGETRIAAVAAFA
ncbi:MAG: EF-P lysine aminoacylase EpmA [Gammaproteobacteria bacterium]